MNESPPGPLLVVDGVSKTFAGEREPVSVLRAVSFRLLPGEFVCLLGPSGSGKSTLLRIIGGLLAADDGQVRLLDQPVHAPQSNVGFVFQATNLMPWRTVLQNVLLPLEIRKGRVDDDDRARAGELLHTVGLEGFEHVYPKHLSGGMGQRVVLARTLIHSPELLLMDEPFGALDALTRERLNLELLRVHRMQTKTVLMVTHSIAEAVFLADRVLVFGPRPGHILAEVKVDLPRPRRLAAMSSEHFGLLTMEVRRQVGYLDDDA